MLETTINTNATKKKTDRLNNNKPRIGDRETTPHRKCQSSVGTFKLLIRRAIIKEIKALLTHNFHSEDKYTYPMKNVS